MKSDDLITQKMGEAGFAAPAISAFLDAVRQVQAGATGLVPESEIEPVRELPRLEELPGDASSGQELLRELAVVKLNGGLGTGMGLEGPKSLLKVKGEETFLDFIARQILHLRGGASEPAFYLMDSFSTQAETVEYLRKYPELFAAGAIDFLQSKVPKLEAGTLEPISWPKDPALEWCPPGHGDLYPSMLGSGLMHRLLERGIRYLFVSNSDNLGAAVDFKLLRYFADSELSFLMEVAERTGADRKGGHLARRQSNGRLLLRDLVQCPEEDHPQFQDIQRHRYFNTNTLWIRLDRLVEQMERKGGLNLPVVKNAKTVDPRDPASPKVLQLESVMGTAIESFERSGAVVVPRTRFAPVKTTSDLLALRSDAYEITEDYRLVLAEARRGQPPLVELDGEHYKMAADFEKRFAEGTPSLVNCDRLKVTGPLDFSNEVVCRGEVEFVNSSSQTRRVPPGIYESGPYQIPPAGDANIP